MNEKFLSPFKFPGASASELVDMMRSFLNYTLPLLVRSSALPPKLSRKLRSSGGEVVEVVADNFQEVVMDPEAHVFVVFYSPTCPASRSVMPVLKEVSKAAHQELHEEDAPVVVGRMDLTSNDLPIRDCPVFHYPTAYLFPRLKEGETKKVPINFANFNGEHMEHDKDRPHSHFTKKLMLHFIENEAMPPSHHHEDLPKIEY